MRFPWDEDDPKVRSRIHANLAVLLPDIVASGRRRDPVTIDLMQVTLTKMLADYRTQQAIDAD